MSGTTKHPESCNNSKRIYQWWSSKSNYQTSLIHLLLLSVLFLDICGCWHNAAMTMSRTAKESFSFSFKSLKTNKRTCREAYDHCANGSVTGDHGLQTSRMSPSLMNDILFQQSRCFCDDDCRKYGDCCLDVMLPDILATMSDHTMSPNGFQVKESPWKCHKFVVIVNLKKKNVTAYVKASCPFGWKDENVRNLCHKSVMAPLYDYTLDIPIVSQKTNTTYINVYCAICHNETKFAPLSLSLNCPLELQPKCTENWTEWQYIPHENCWNHIKDHLLKITFDIVIDPDATDYYQHYGVRRCNDDIVDTCPDADISKANDRHLCAKYGLTVFSRPQGKLYKNKHCAICNGIDRDEPLSCPSSVQSYDTTMGTTHSYSMLIDFIGEDDEVGVIGKCGANGRTSCHFGQICDSIQNRCRSYTCGQHFQMSADGQCFSVTDEGQSKDIIDRPEVTLGCPKVYYYRDQFIFLPNRSIYINETAFIYNASEYEETNGSAYILVCAKTKPSVGWKFSDRQDILSVICVTISLCCLVIHITVHAVLPKLRNLPGKNLLSLSCSLCIAQFLFCFGLGLQALISNAMCVTVAVLIHYGFLATFFWMNVMAIDICRTFTHMSYLMPRSNSMKDYYKYCAYAWMTPLVIVSMALINDVSDILPGYQPNYARQLCWINNRKALLTFFVLPLAVLMVMNVILFALTVAGICYTARKTKVARRDSSAAREGISSEKARVLLYSKLAIIMGLTWIFAFVASFTQIELFWNLFIMFNALQGAFIFFAFSFKKNILLMLWNKYQHRRWRTRGSKTGSSNRTQSQGTTQVLLLTPHHCS